MTTALGFSQEQKQETPSREDEVSILPGERLFSPLLASPRWPHFAASYHYYLDDDELRKVGAVGFGESFSIIRKELDYLGEIEFGIEPGVFSTFDLEAESKDLINADYRIALSLSHRKGPLSSLLQVYHQSSHLGDEFILRNRVDERINLSYESISILTSVDIYRILRLYGGGDYILQVQPKGIDRWTLQAGLEASPPLLLADESLKPVFAADLQASEETDWIIDLSLRLGFQVQDDFGDRGLIAFAEYYNGTSPNGQFYERVIHYIGFGLHMFLF